MLFNSFHFAFFVTIAFGLYWGISSRHLSLQNLLIVVASYVFYAWWDWRFLILIWISTAVDYFVGLKLEHERRPRQRKILLWFSIAVNLVILGFFKYFNFFIENFIALFSILHRDLQFQSLNIILPVGLSFYTFQSLSYTIDVYKKKLKATNSIIEFAAFVAFFPQLVAGPIERAKNLLPQFQGKRRFDYAQSVDGMRQILWGLFKKVVIADNCGVFADQIFGNSASMNGSTLVLGALFFTFQIYADFSAYSDIAIGTARLFGFNLRQNFAYPFFSRDFKEVWQRWHISLTDWFRDYLFKPLVKSMPINGFTKTLNVFILFLSVGLWHGANWTFVVWGGLHALFFLPNLFIRKDKGRPKTVAQGRMLPSLREWRGMLVTFSLGNFAMIFFRAESLGHALVYISGILSPSLLAMPEFVGMGRALLSILLVFFLILVEWHGRERQYAISHLGLHWPRALRWGFYAGLVLMMGLFKPTVETEFIYFQF